jgi:small multidrug resistance pump
MEQAQRPARPTIAPWMTRLLWFVGGYNLLAGVGMFGLYHEGYKLLSLDKPQLNLPIQLVGILVGLFGVGYWMVAAHPIENRNILLLGFWSKALGSALGIYYVCVGKLPPLFIAVLFFSDIAYLPPFFVILRQIKRAAGSSAGN